MTIEPVYIVRRPDPTNPGSLIYHSAWFDVYDARFEVNRWSQDRKEVWDYVEGKLVLEDKANAATAQVV